MNGTNSKPPRSNEGLLLGLTGLLILVGIVLRLRQFRFRRSLWLDEAMLAVNIVSRSATDLFLPLEYNQNAPPLFLLAEKAATTLFGVNELALRAAPQIAGWFVLGALTLALWRSLGAWGAFLGASLAALSPALIRFANEAKPYGVDASVTAMFLAMILDRDDAYTSRRWVWLGVVGCVGVWFSHPAVFVAAAMAIGLLARFRATPTQLRSAFLVGATWLLAFLISYSFLGRRDAGNEQVRAGYSTAFLPPSGPSLDRLPLMISGTFLPAFRADGTSAPELSWAQSAGLVAGLALTVVAANRSLGTWVALPLAGPIAFAYGASILGLYPIGVPRLMVFGYPCVIALVCFPLTALFTRLSPRAERLAALLWLLVLWPSWTLAAQSWATPFRGDDFRGAYTEYSSLQLGEPVYISAKAQPAWLFYSTNWEPDSRRQKELMARRLRFYFDAGGRGPSFENAASRGRPLDPSEGAGLVFDFRGRMEVLGIAAGRQWKWPAYVSPVDPGWETHEARRVRAAGDKAGRPCEWLVFERLSELSYRPLRNALRFEHKGRLERQLSYPGVTIAQICH